MENKEKIMFPEFLLYSAHYKEGISALMVCDLRENHGMFSAKFNSILMIKQKYTKNK